MATCTAARTRLIGIKYFSTSVVRFLSKSRLLVRNRMSHNDCIDKKFDKRDKKRRQRDGEKSNRPNG